MQETYKASGITDFTGRITQAKTITFVKDNISAVTSVTTQPVLTTSPVNTLASSATDVVPAATSSPVAKKTTYSPAGGMDCIAWYHDGGFVYYYQELVKDCSNPIFFKDVPSINKKRSNPMNFNKILWLIFIVSGIILPVMAIDSSDQRTLPVHSILKVLILPRRKI